MDDTKKPLTYIIVFNAGAYGNFVGWAIEWLTGKVSVNSRPWDYKGSAHKNNLVIYRTVDDACAHKKTGIMHPVQDNKTLLNDVLNRLIDNFDKVILLYPEYDNLIWNMNNKFEKVFKHGWLQENIKEVSADLKLWKKDISALEMWELREWLSYFIFSQSLSETRFYEIDTIDSKILKINLTELRDETEMVFEKICNFLNLKIVRNKQDIFLLINEWKELQKHKYKDQLVNHLVDAIVTNKNVEFDNLTIIDEAEIQRKLREDHGIEIKCYGLDQWPKTTIELTPLLIRRNQ